MEQAEILTNAITQTGNSLTANHQPVHFISAFKQQTRAFLLEQKFRNPNSSLKQVHVVWATCIL